MVTAVIVLVESANESNLTPEPSTSDLIQSDFSTRSPLFFNHVLVIQWSEHLYKCAFSLDYRSILHPIYSQFFFLG